MEKLSDESIRSLIDANQTAIKQLGKDIRNLERKLDNKTITLSNSMESMQRDIKDRWQYLSDITKELEKTIKGDKYAKKKSKD